MRFLALDVGGTTGKVALYDNLTSTEALDRETFPVTQHTEGEPGDFTADYRAMRAACRRLRGTRGRLDAIGLAVAGEVNEDRTRLNMAGNVAHWVGHPVGQMLARTFACEVVLGNDAEAAALAEARYGLGCTEYQGQDILAMIWGTGVGGALTFVAGDRLRARNIEPGHVVIRLNVPFRCRGCQECGHLEAYCGGANLPTHFGVKTEDLSDASWLQAAQWMADGLELILRDNPVDAISFSGGVACKQAWLLPILEQELADRRGATLPVRQSAFGEEAGTIGGLALLSL